MSDHLGAGVAAEIAEAVIAEDDRPSVDLGVGNDEVTICAQHRTHLALV